MSFIRFLRNQVASIPAILGVSANGTFVSAADPMMKVLR